MYEWLKRMLCAHGDMKIVEDKTFIQGLTWQSEYSVVRRYLYCPKCGYKRKISKY